MSSLPFKKLCLQVETSVRWSAIFHGWPHLFQPRMVTLLTSIYHKRVPQKGDYTVPARTPTLFKIALLGFADEPPNTFQVSIYANDECIWASSRTTAQLCARLQEALNVIKIYLKRWVQTVSTGKSAMLPSLHLSGRCFPIAPMYMFLEVMTDRGIT